MNVGGGEAADQMVRMMLSGGEVTVRLGASAIKNLAAITCGHYHCISPQPQNPFRQGADEADAPADP